MNRLYLDQIERKLEAFFESNSLFYQWLDPRTKLARLLTAAMENNMQELPDGSFLAPNKYIILLSNDDYAFWQDHLSELDSLAVQLFTVSKELQLKMNSLPVILLEKDSRLVHREVKIFSDVIHEEHFSTTVVTLDQESEPQEDQIPENAYLIYNVDHTFPLTKPLVCIGRKQDNDLVIEDPRISRYHIQLRSKAGSYILLDLDTTGGTKVNDRLVNQVMLKSGDVISLAGVTLIFVQEHNNPISDTTQTKKVNSEGEVIS